MAFPLFLFLSLLFIRGREKRERISNMGSFEKIYFDEVYFLRRKIFPYQLIYLIKMMTHNILNNLIFLIRYIRYTYVDVIQYKLDVL